MKVAHLTTVDLSLRFLLMPQLMAIVDAGGEAIGISASGEYVGELEEAGVRHVELRASTRSMDVAADLAAARELWGILRRERPDVLHTHNPKPGLYGRIVGRLAGVPLVVNTVHGLYASPDDRASKRALVYSLEALASRFSDAELVQNSEDRELMSRLRIAPKSHLRLLGNGVDLQHFDPDRFDPDVRGEVRAELGIESGEVVFGTVGRLVAEKGYRELFEAHRQLDGRYRVVCVGPNDPDKDDALGTEVVRQARDQGVILTGMRRDVDRLYSAFDVFVLPTYREGFPRAAMEAAAMGLPVIATDIRGCRQVVDDEVNGLLIPVRDPAALAGAMERLAADPNLRGEMSRAARVRAVERFDERRVVEVVMDTYREVSRSKGLDLFGGGARTELAYRRALPGDAPALAGIHSRAIDTGFLPELGMRFMRVLYRALISEEEAEVLVADDGFGVVGFVAGVSSTRRFYRRFALRHGFAALLASLPRLLIPSVLRRAVETFTYGSGGGGRQVGAELLAMAVLPSIRGGGVGTELGRRFLDAISSKGGSPVKVVVGAQNEPALALYRRLGFADEMPLEVHSGEASVELLWSA